MLLRIVLFLLLATPLLASELRVGTLNCFLLFSPAVVHQGSAASQQPLSREEYRQKIRNLLSMVSDCDFVGLQELGGRPEAEDLAKAAGWEWALFKGKDTYTGEEVGAIYHLPGWKVTRNGRIRELDAIVSKHLLVTATKGTRTIRFLVLHLLRPIGNNASKSARQLAAIHAWALKTRKQEPGTSLVILGDTNEATTAPGSSLFGIGKEAGELAGFAATHLDGRPYDRLVLVGPGSWSGVTINRPPYGKRPNDLLKRLWTDHFAFKATLQLE